MAALVAAHVAGPRRRSQLPGLPSCVGVWLHHGWQAVAPAMNIELSTDSDRIAALRTEPEERRPANPCGWFFRQLADA